MKRLNLLLTFLIGVAILFSVYSARWIFNFKYDVEYFEHFYYHSQWHIPESTRTISDDDLYKFIGYKLATGENPFNINFEVPPGVKYLYGLSELHFGNPYWVSLSFYLISIVIFWLLAQEIFKKISVANLATLLFVLQPFVASQIGQTMLDLPMLVFLMTHMLFVLKGVERKSFLLLLVAGISLGLAAGTKIGIYSVLIGVVSGLYILIKLKNIIPLMVMGVATLAGYCLSYLCYFMYHPNPLPWIRLHKQVALFYLNSDVNPNFANQYLSIFLGKFDGWWENGKGIVVKEWSILLPLGFIALIRGKLNSKYLFVIAFILILVNTLVPFYPRYLILIIPFLTLALAGVINKYKLLTFVCVVLGFFHLYQALTPSKAEALEKIKYFISVKNNRELYQLIDGASKSQYSLLDWDDALSKSQVTISNEPDMVLESNQWRLVWSEKFLSPQAKIKYTQPKIVVIPERIADWPHTLRSLEKVNGLTVNENLRLIKLQVPDKYPVPISSVSSSATKIDISNLTQLPGVSIVKD